MPSSDGIEKLFEDLRLLAAKNPREARVRFFQILDSEISYVNGLLERVSAPGEGRLRQLISNAVRVRSDKEKVIPYILRWYKNETDEFAKRAIEAALEGVDKSAYQLTNQQSIANPALVKIYRHVTDRIQHQIRNALMPTDAKILKLRRTSQSHS